MLRASDSPQPDWQGLGPSLATGRGGPLSAHYPVTARSPHAQGDTFYIQLYTASRDITSGPSNSTIPQTRVTPNHKNHPVSVPSPGVKAEQSGQGWCGRNLTRPSAAGTRARYSEAGFRFLTTGTCNHKAVATTSPHGLAMFGLRTTPPEILQRGEAEP